MGQAAAFMSMRESESLRPFRPLVVGAPRSGFSLLIAVLAQIYAFTPGKRQAWRGRLQKLAAGQGPVISAAIRRVFAARGLDQDLVYNATFQDVAGGPKWLDPDRPERACFRKYIGVRGMGDFTLVTSHPRALLDIYEVVHSHSNPALWAADPGYGDYTKFASLRNPAGVINSSCYSLNALTSEYLTRFRPQDAQDDELRLKLALYKLTDLDFFSGLITPLKTHLQEYLACRDRWHGMKWEELIDTPGPTIARLAAASGVTLDAGVATGMWEVLRDRNLTGAHAHNYRRGHGRVGEWRGSLINEHLELLRAQGMEDIAVALGYQPFTRLRESEYTEVQKKISDHVRHGSICREMDDEVLFGFAFNKSNLDASRYDFFRSYPWREHTRVERSCFADETLLLEAWDAAEDAVRAFNVELNALLQRESTAAVEISAADAATMDPPRLLYQAGNWNVVAFKGRFFGVPTSMGPVDLEQADVEKMPGLLQAQSHDELRAQIPGRRPWSGLRQRLGI